MDTERLEHWQNNGEAEYVMCAAILIKRWNYFIGTDTVSNFQPYNVDEEDLCVAGWRHAQCWETVRILSGKNQNYFQLSNTGTRMWEDGFLTNKNRFLNREESLQLVVENLQLKNQLIGGFLTSEDLW
jgi:hypothetical protein